MLPYSSKKSIVSFLLVIAVALLSASCSSANHDDVISGDWQIGVIDVSLDPEDRRNMQLEVELINIGKDRSTLPLVFTKIFKEVARNPISWLDKARSPHYLLQDGNGNQYMPYSSKIERPAESFRDDFVEHFVGLNPGDKAKVTLKFSTHINVDRLSFRFKGGLLDEPVYVRILHTW